MEKQELKVVGLKGKIVITANIEELKLAWQSGIKV